MSEKLPPFLLHSISNKVSWGHYLYMSSDHSEAGWRTGITLRCSFLFWGAELGKRVQTAQNTDMLIKEITQWIPLWGNHFSKNNFHTADRQTSQFPELCWNSSTRRLLAAHKFSSRLNPVPVVLLPWTAQPHSGYLPMSLFWCIPPQGRIGLQNQQPEMMPFSPFQLPGSWNFLPCSRCSSTIFCTLRPWNFLFRGLQASLLSLSELPS